MKTIQKVGYAALASALVANQTFAQINFGGNKVDQRISGTTQGTTAENAVQTLIGNAMFVLGIVAVCYGLYGGFLMLTAGGDDGKVKTGKTILIQVAIGLVVIFLANSIVQFVLTRILGGQGVS